ncbi:hypothetical protein FS749_015059, partial [Ceratobasidium sp. UAMH 11750]
MPHVNIAPIGTTEAPRELGSSRDAPIGIYPSPATRDDLDDDHLRGRRRIFIGPMPENVAARLCAASASGTGSVSIPSDEFAREDFARDDLADDASSSTSDSDSDSDSDCNPGQHPEISRKRLLRAFLRRGGRRDQFSEQEIRKRWRAGGWSRVPLPVDASARRWVGSSFEVGVDIVAGMSSGHDSSAHALRDGREVERELDSSGEGKASARSHVAPAAPSRTTTMETFVTARSSARGDSDAEDSAEDKGEIKPIDVEAIPRRNSSKSTLTPASSGGGLLPQLTIGEPSTRATSTSPQSGTLESTSPLLPAGSPKSPTQTRPHSTLGVPHMFTDENGNTKPQAASAPHLAGVLDLPKERTGGVLRSALRRNLGSLRRSSTKQHSVIFAESPQPLSNAHQHSLPSIPRSAT